MSEGAPRSVVTANRLRDGVPVYFAGAGRWSPSIADAFSVEAGDGESLLALTQSGPQPLAVVAPYLIEATVDAEGVHPVSLRERIRAFGPTI